MAAEQHYSHLKRVDEHEVPMHPMGGYPYGAYPLVPGNPYGHVGYEGEYARHADPYAADEYARGPHYPAREGHSYYHADPYARHDTYGYHDAYHYDPYHHPKPPKSEGEAEKHMGPEAAYFYQEMHKKQQQQ